YGFVNNLDHAHDNRWMHRPVMPWGKLTDVKQRILDGTRAIITRRKTLPQLCAANPTLIVDSGNKAIFSFVREGDEGPLLAIFNFSELWQNIPADFARGQGITAFQDALSGGKVAVE